ncbi:type II toxin-antitoxin system PemK/MazF family toxin [candidate division KSB1 bacterium]|nr:type II toxin-antitoxin system PemK/MazF family toxin [candidate division KSB1 bacterium]
MALQRGDIVLVDFPFVDRTGSKLRPALVVSSSIYYTERPQDIIVAVISTQTQRYSGSTDYFIQDWRAAGLSHPCVLRCTLLTILSSRINHKIGTLSKNDLLGASNCLRLALEL